MSGSSTPRWQQLKIKEVEAFERVNEIKPNRVFEEELASDPSRWVMSFSMVMVNQLESAGCLDGAHAIWSMWPGYLEKDRQQAMLAHFESLGIPFEIQHTSGHASIDDLQRRAQALSPDRVVPIHSFGGARFHELFDGVEVHADGEWWAV
jgi:ribonuclease J